MASHTKNLVYFKTLFTSLKKKKNKKKEEKSKKKTDNKTAELLKSFRKKEWVGDYLFPSFFENFFLLKNGRKEKSM